MSTEPRFADVPVESGNCRLRCLFGECRRWKPAELEFGHSFGPVETG